MTDHELDEGLRAWYRREVGEHERAPSALRVGVSAIPRTVPVKARFENRRTVLLAAAAILAALLIGGAITVGSGILRLGTIQPSPSVPGPSPAAVPTASPNATPAATPIAAAWTATGAMAQVRGGGLSATLLPDGRVLVTGGARAQSAPAELFDPGTGRWTATGRMVEHRLGQTATILRDGRVLIVGGQGDDGSSLASAELYDPGAGRWTATGSMSVARTQYTATLLPSGKVLVAGGSSIGSKGYKSLASAEVYDPSTGRWSPTGRMAGARYSHSATLLADGTVLVAGGSSDGTDDHPLASAELYDPASGRWTTTGPMGEARSRHTATLLRDGRVLAVGSFDNGFGTHSASAELFDPQTGRWTATGSLAETRFLHTATLLSDGQVLVAGGLIVGPGGADDIYLTSAELYDPTTGRWSRTAKLAVARGEHTATLLADGTILVAGGHDNGGPFSYLSSAELYMPSSGN